MHVASPEAWGNKLLRVADRLKISAFATGFRNVRSLYTLTNGGVLAAEPKAPSEAIFLPSAQAEAIADKEGLAHAAVAAPHNELS
jgi:glucose/arabinose dehydrogenase